MTVLIITAGIETTWLLTIYGKRFFEWWDRAQARLDQLLDDELQQPIGDCSGGVR
jgi:hypothetical protein